MTTSYNKKAIILIRKEKYDDFSEYIFDDITKPEDPPQTLGFATVKTNFDPEYFLVTIPTKRIKGSHDDFLCTLATRYFNSVEKDGAVIGLVDKDGYLWSDYKLKEV